MQLWSGDFLRPTTSKKPLSENDSSLHQHSFNLNEAR